jgi:cell division protein FtsB
MGLLENPVKVLSVAVAAALVGLLTQGTFLDLWNLHREIHKLQGRYRDTLKYNESMKTKIEQARTSDKFIGRQAREKLDLVQEDEMVFIFENEPTPVTPSQRL